MFKTKKNPKNERNLNEENLKAAKKKTVSYKNP